MQLLKLKQISLKINTKQEKKNVFRDIYLFLNITSMIIDKHKHKPKAINETL